MATLVRTRSLVVLFVQVVPVAAACVLYAGGVLRLAARSRRWPVARSIAFGSGLAAVVVATASPLAARDSTSFSAHMVQHVLLGMLAPMLFALGAPVTLALQASTRARQRGILRVVRSRPVAWLTHPVVGWSLFGGSLVAIYFTPLLELSLRNEVVHVSVHLHLLVVGSLFMWPLVGLDPVRWRLPHFARLGAVVLAVPFHAFLGLALLSERAPLAPGWYSIGDQRAAAGILWAVGDLFGVVAGGVVVAQWMRADEREAVRTDRRLAAGGATEVAPDRPASPVRRG